MKNEQFHHLRIEQKHYRNQIILKIKQNQKQIKKQLSPLVSKSFFANVANIRLCYHNFLILIFYPLLVDLLINLS